MPPVKAGQPVRTCSAVIERCSETGLLVGHVAGFPGAHSLGETLDELQANLQEVIAMLLRQIAKDIGMSVEEIFKYR
jgi:predicted RNase H-like HicB family nuclease